MYYLLLPTAEARAALIAHLKSRGIHAVFHYVPLHASEQGRRTGRVAGEMTLTEDLSARLLRLPLWLGLESSQAEIIDEITQHLQGA